MAALQLKELEGTMHRSEDVEAVMTDLVYNIRSMLIALPGRLAVDVVAAQTAAEASEIIRAEANRRLGATDTGSSSGSQTSGSTDDGLKVGDVVTFSGSKHYTSAAGSSGSTCKPARLRSPPSPRARPARTI